MPSIAILLLIVCGLLSHWDFLLAQEVSFEWSVLDWKELFYVGGVRDELIKFDFYSHL
uniref:Uncharacterized protein n=1 Tax=Anopheles quadriannulatus TaxID=34691 RepID=A0A182XSR7_ANOQN